MPEAVAAILREDLDGQTDWIVLNCALEALAALARDDAALVPMLRADVARFADDPRRSLASRAARLRRELG